MSIRRYLPSAKFVSIVGSLAISVGLVFAADAVTHKTSSPVEVAVVDSTPIQNTNWEAALYAVQSQTASSSYESPDPNFVNNLLQSAQSKNVTETVGKTLLINLTNAKTQGLGDDIPTQNQIISAAQAQIKGTSTTTVYKLTNLTIVPDSATNLHNYGNAVIAVFNAHPAANQYKTLVAIDDANTNQDASALLPLSDIQTGYDQITKDLLAIPVPSTISPLHLLVVNDFARVTKSYDDMKATLSDPLRGIAGLQNYQNALDEASRVFINIAQALNKGGILFSKEEPGSAWAGFLSP